MQDNQQYSLLPLTLIVMCMFTLLLKFCYSDAKFLCLPHLQKQGRNEVCKVISFRRTGHTSGPRVTSLGGPVEGLCCAYKFTINKFHTFCCGIFCIFHSLVEVKG